MSVINDSSQIIGIISAINQVGWHKADTSVTAVFLHAYPTLTDNMIF